MILKYSLLGNLLLLWMNIVNSVVMVGLYYGFLTTFSIGPSYLLLLRTRVMKEVLLSIYIFIYYFLFFYSIEIF